MLAHLSTIIVSYIQSGGYVAVFVLMTLESALLPVPSEIVMPFAGFLASKGSFAFPLLVLVGALGNLLGSLIGYGIGYALEESVLLKLIRKYGRFILVSEEDYQYSAAWFKKYGDGVILVSRLLPAIRTYISLPAGALKMNLWKFTAYTFIGSLLWSGFLAYVGFYLGSKWDVLGPIFSKVQYGIALLLLIGIGYFVYRKLRKR